MDQFEPLKYPILKIDNQMHILINYLCVTGEQEQQGFVSSIYNEKNLLRQQEEIDTILMKIKPGICNILFKKYSKDMVFTYLNGLYNYHQENN